MSDSTADDTDVPAEVQHTLSRLSAYKNVRGVLITARSSGGIVQQTGSAFEGDRGKEYGRIVAGIVAAVSAGVGQLDEGDDLRLMRLRTRKHELIVTPDDKYLLVVLQDPA